MKTLRTRSLIIVLICVLVPIAVLAQSGGGYDLSWFTIAGGGGSSQGGSYSVSDTLGQLDTGNSSGGQYSVQSGFWSGIAGGPVPVHVIAILSFDNNLSPLTAEVIERFRQGTEGQSDLRVTLLADQVGEGNTEVIEIASGVVTHTNAIPWLSGVHELDTASPDAISAFLSWARAQQLGQRDVIALLGHGAGLAPEVHGVQPGQFGILSQLPPLPSARDNTPVDVTSGTYLSTPELGRALVAATNNGANPADVLFLDSCFEGNLDVLYEVRNTAQVLIASPNYSWGGFFYDQYLPHMTPTATPEDMAQAIIAEYQAALDDTHPNAIFWVRGTDVGAIADAVSNLGDALRSKIGAQPSSASTIYAAVANSQFADTTLCAGDLVLCPPDELIGAGSFAANLRARFLAGSPVHTAAGNVLTQLVNVHGAYRTGHPWVKPANTWAYTDTLTIIAPLTRTLTTDLAWRRTIYTSTAPLTAIWAVQPTQTVVITAPLAYTINGHWDDFIAAWYGPMTPTVGVLCHALPPTQIISDTAAITLTAQADLNSAQLNWTSVSHPDLADYAVYVQRPYGPTWELLAITSTLAHQHTGLSSGRYGYFVAARNAQGNILARSNETWVDVGLTSVEPDRGLNNVPTLVYLRGSGFALPLTVTVGSTQLQDLLLIDSHLIRAVVPASITPATYDVAVNTPSGQAIAYGAFRVLDAGMVDDLHSSEEWLWTSPDPLRVGRADNQIFMAIQRLGGKATLDSVTVEFRLGGPQGTPFGRGWTPPVAPFSMTISSPVLWTPQAAGNYQVCGVIDPDNQVAETDETNNITCRSITVLAPAADTVPPNVNSFVIDRDAPTTSALTVTLTVTSTDYPTAGASGVQACKFIEFEYNLGVRRWVPIQQSGWITYAAANNNYPWRLLPTFGMRYMEAWCRDNVSNISLRPSGDIIELMPSIQEGYVAQYGVVFYRVALQQGQAFTASLMPIDGDPDLYIWGPDNLLWYSNNQAGSEDAIAFNVPMAGIYQIEVHGYTDAHYRLTFGAQSSQARSESVRAQTTNTKLLPAAPVVALTEWPPYYQLSAPPRFNIYLPVVVR